MSLTAVLTVAAVVSIPFSGLGSRMTYAPTGHRPVNASYLALQDPPRPPLPQQCNVSHHSGPDPSKIAASSTAKVEAPKPPSATQSCYAGCDAAWDSCVGIAASRCASMSLLAVPVWWKVAASFSVCLTYSSMDCNRNFASCSQECRKQNSATDGCKECFIFYREPGGVQCSCSPGGFARGC